MRWYIAAVAGNYDKALYIPQDVGLRDLWRLIRAENSLKTLLCMKKKRNMFQCGF